ncbi:MAG: hypothetical protein PHD65_07815 [Gallionella sp.]|nr:hypothetical protein [Gallionella sp.]
MTRPTTQINFDSISPAAATTIHRRMAGDIAEGKRVVTGITVQMVAATRAVDSIVAATAMDIIVAAGAAQVIGLAGSSGLMS